MTTPSAAESADSFTDLFDLASERLGGAVIAANDEFFAEKENLLRAKKPVFLEHEYTDRGKWMDGWETRRRRTPGHDHCIVRLGLPGVVRGVVIDTAFFRGNYPDRASISACAARPDATLDALAAANWVEILPESKLQGDSRNLFPIDSPYRFTHLRLDIYPDGGVARLRVHGDVVPDPRRLGGELDVAAVESGARVLSCSDMFFGVRHNLIMPGRAVNMGDGWETKRRRGPGHDWAILELAGPAELRRIELDTNHFKGNFPDSCTIEGACLEGPFDAAKASFRPVLQSTKLSAHTRHFFEDELVDAGPFTHLRLAIFPDGGVSRLRVHGSLTPGGLVARRLAGFNCLVPADAERALTACCASHAWTTAMTAARPFRSLPAMLEAADAWAKGLTKDDWLEAFAAHPRIGQRRAERPAGGAAEAWSKQEQAGVADADAKVLAELEEANRAYDAKFGHVFLVCATGKSAIEMLGLVRERMNNAPDAELAVAAAEHRKITALRLEKMFR